MNHIPYAEWLDRADVQKQNWTPSTVPKPLSMPAETIPASYIVKAIDDHLDKSRPLRSGLRLHNVTIVDELNLRDYKIPFSIYFVACWFEASLRMPSIRIPGLGFENCRLRQAIDLRGANLDSSFHARNGTVCDGPFLIRDVKIGGQADFSEATFAYDGNAKATLGDAAEGECFSFSRSEATALYWLKLGAQPTAKMSLRDAKVRTFMHDMNTDQSLSSWPPNRQLILDGFSYDRIGVLPAETGLSWLRLTETFSPSAYSALARGFRRLSLLHSAETILAELKRREIDHMEPAIKRWFNRTIFGLIGYGSKPHLALIFLAALFATSVAGSYAMKALKAIEPSVNELLLEPCFLGPSPQCDADLSTWGKVEITGLGPRYVPPVYPEFEPLLYSIESFIPILEPKQRKYWEPANVYVQLFFAALAAFGIFMGGLFIGSVSGLLSPKVEDTN